MIGLLFELFLSGRLLENDCSVLALVQILAPEGQITIIAAMKLLLVTAAHFLIIGVLGAGIYMLMHGKPGLLIAGVTIYSLVFSKTCLSSH